MTKTEQELVDASAICEALRPHFGTIDDERTKLAWEQKARPRFLAALEAYIAEEGGADAVRGS